LKWSPKRTASVLALGAMAVSLSCSLSVGSGSVDKGCPDDMKACDGSCVPLDDHLYGCARDSCGPCALERATATCGSEGECVVAACAATWADCDGDSKNGCEVNTDSSDDHCGACDAACDAPSNGSAACGNAACYVTECEQGFGDCNRKFEDGCEVDLANDPLHCGACGVPCAECDAPDCDD